MQLFGLILVLASSIVSANGVQQRREPPQQLEIKTTVPVKDCLRAVKIRDNIGVTFTANIWNTDKVFDKSPENGMAEFIVGRRSNDYPAGMQEGLVGACLGESRHIVVPSELGFVPDPIYGYSSVPPKAPYGSVLEYHIRVDKIYGFKTPAEIAEAETEVKDEL
ncbi:Peptidyl-prolyl cis-trans isomerase fpr2 [Rhizoclosmatium sp. JEL0117]|nr:Peptidyl-prolyl cis-trans isomerase fpr2 [Rhizoclosmatium sp. JEL0117]